MKCAAITLIVLGLLASPQPAATLEFNSFSGNPVESRDWSQLCIEKDGNYLACNGDSDKPFAGRARTSDAANSASANARRRRRTASPLFWESAECLLQLYRGMPVGMQG